MIVYLNGELVPAERAAISIDDPGFGYGEGIYETILVRKGRLAFWEDHWSRFRASADALGVELPLTFAQATGVVRELVLRNDLPDAIGRFQVTGAGLPDRPTGQANGRPEGAPPRGTSSVLVRIASLPIYSPEEVLRGWKVVLSRLPYTPFLPHVKHTSRLANVLARRAAAREGAEEAILLDGGRVLLEGTRSNLFFVLEGILYTPALECGILAGVTREKVLRVAAREGIPVNEGVHAPAELGQAAEVFLTFSSAGVMPVTDVDGRPVGQGRMGPITQRLKAAYDRVLAGTLARAPALA